MESLSRGKAEAPGSAYIFASFRLEAGGELRRGDAHVEIPTSELAVLRLLLADPGKIVSAARVREAMAGAAAGAEALAPVVTPQNASACIAALGERLAPDNCIETLYKRGYRLSVPVRVEQPSSGGEARAEPAPPAVAGQLLAIVPLEIGAEIPEYLGLALAEDMADRLMRPGSGALRIAAPQSVATLVSRGLSAQQIGEAMGAGLVLTGSVSALPTHLRVRMQMMDAAGDELWREDVLMARAATARMSEELAARVVARLESGMLPESEADWAAGDAASIAAQADEHPAGALEAAAASGSGAGAVAAANAREAWELMERARYEWRTLERHQMQDALQWLLRAVNSGEPLAEARVELARLCVEQSLLGYMPSASAAQMLRYAAAPGQDQDGPVQRMGQTAGTGSHVPPDLAILPMEGWFHFHFHRDLSAALDDFGRSAHLPHDPWTTNVRALFALSRRRFGEAIDLLSAALQLDPWCALLHARLAWALYLAGEDEASVKQAGHALREFPEEESPALFGALILAAHGDAERAVPVARGLTQRRPYWDAALGVLAYALACSGRQEEARDVLERLDWMSRERYVLNTFAPAAWVALGEPAAALEQLCLAANARCPWFFQMLADPRLASLRPHPEFQQMEGILARMEAACELA